MLNPSNSVQGLPLKYLDNQLQVNSTPTRLEEGVRINLDKYVEFIDANASSVVSEARKLLFRKDEEFKHWLGQHPNNGNQEQTQGDALTKTA